MIIWKPEQWMFGYGNDIETEMDKVICGFEIHSPNFVRSTLRFSHFISLISIYTRKHQKTSGLLMFSGGIERDRSSIKWIKNLTFNIDQS